VSGLATSHILLTPEQSRAADAWAVAHGTDGLTLMETAGRAVAEILTDYIGTPSECDGDILLLCGPGNNGGDGYVVARLLDDWGYSVRLMSVVPTADLKGDAAGMASRWAGPVEGLDKLSFKGVGVIVDALFGTGLVRPVEGDIAALIDKANRWDAFRLAVDVPSGLDAGTGQVLGTCFQADATVTFFARKPGQVIAPGRLLCGGHEHVHVADIGIAAACLEEIAPATFENEPGLWGGLYPHAGPATHKYHRGHLLVLGGKEPTLGACRLASMAALRAGAGLVTLAAPSETYAIQAAALTDVMVRRFDSAFGFLGMVADGRIRVVLVGPGAGVSEKTAEVVQEVAARGRSMVLDADALTSLVGRLELLQGAGEVVLTPHDGEFARLFPDIDLSGDRIAAARAAAAATGAVVVLKGVSTLVAAPDGRLSIAANAPAWLSVGGTGDVLSGIVAGLLAQGMPAFEAASAGVWLQGEAAMQAGRGMIASDLVAALPKVLP
jgi:hydroxyethylthiazole kinase-like uncharacterized protein yjeF